MPDKELKRIAVSGSNGQLGKELAQIANRFSEYSFIFLDRETFPLHDADKIRTWIEKNPVDFFINCAAYTAVDKAESDRDAAFQANAIAPGVIAECLKNRNTQLIHVSTDYVFDGKSETPLPENADTAPVNYYGFSKLSGEELVLKNNPHSQVVRTSWLYSSFGNNFVKTMIRLMKDKEAISVVEDQHGSPTYAADLALAIMQMIQSPRFIPGIYHYSNLGETNWFEFASEIKKLTGSPCKISPIPSSGFPTPAKRPAYSLMDKSKITRDYHLVIPDWKASLALCIERIDKL